MSQLVGLTRLTGRGTLFCIDAREELRLVEDVANRLASKHSQLPIETVVATVADAHAQFDGKRIRNYVPLLVERRVEEKLAALVSPG